MRGILVPPRPPGNEWGFAIPQWAVGNSEASGGIRTHNFRFTKAVLLAGLSTTIGSVIALIIKKPNPKFISFSMGFSAGVMILIAFVELLQGSIVSIGLLQSSMFFFLGMLIMFAIDAFISHEYEFEDSIEFLTSDNGSCQPHSHHVLYHKKSKGKRQQGPQGLRQGLRNGNGTRPHDGRGRKSEVNLVKTSIFTFLGVFIHNFPEGMATYI